jgi:hypothetical protein
MNDMQHGRLEGGGGRAPQGNLNESRRKNNINLRKSNAKNVEKGPILIGDYATIQNLFPYTIGSEILVL